MHLYAIPYLPYAREETINLQITQAVNLLAAVLGLL